MKMIGSDRGEESDTRPKDTLRSKMKKVSSHGRSSYFVSQMVVELLRL
jgi:hypothetical protein